MSKIIFAKYNQKNCLKNHVVTKLVKNNQNYEIVFEALTTEACEFLEVIKDDIYDAFQGLLDKDKERMNVLPESDKNIEDIINDIEEYMVSKAKEYNYFQDDKYKYSIKYEKIFVDVDDYLNKHAHVELEQRQIQEQLNSLKKENDYYIDTIENQKKRIQELQSVIDDIVNSKSWKLTKPFRKGADAINNK